MFLAAFLSTCRVLLRFDVSAPRARSPRSGPPCARPWWGVILADDKAEHTERCVERAVVHSVSSQKDTEALDCQGRQEGRIVDQEGAEDLDLASASCTAAFAAALAGMAWKQMLSSAGSAPLSSAAARAAQPASVIWVLPK